MSEEDLKSCEVEDGAVEVWPDTVPAFVVFNALLNRWMTAGIDGDGRIIRTGLDLSSLPEIWRRRKIPPAQRDDVFDDLLIMEDAALEQMAANRKGN